MPVHTINAACTQFFNAVYVLSADASNPTAVYIYDAAAKSWSMQAVQNPTGSPAFDPTDFKAILDHDTNVFCAYARFIVVFIVPVLNPSRRTLTRGAVLLGYGGFDSGKLFRTLVGRRRKT